ncbi:septum formation initiator family protein [Croceibacterium sp. LX-88]|uniref:Septum formation initiator family protein n=1 Tax=Croceibacterium selenioxidans TaxID=2838833 RepID=A0ABS5W1T9_9SPHN|nr:septum formation initiator family protein [Croceibacterium selenioxidans]MBT2133664.1 septum formation initiator family protein [Croceibacterium selenioxidans]
MNPVVTKREVVREKIARFGALGVLLLLGGLTFVGPYGVLAWGENLALLQQRQERISKLKAEKDELENLVDRLDPNHVDPDLATELLRKNLNVAHPDEYVIELDKAQQAH